MAKVLVLYYSAYGHIETMAAAVAEGAWRVGALDPIPGPASGQLRIRSPPASGQYNNLRALFPAVSIRKRPSNDY